MEKQINKSVILDPEIQSLDTQTKGTEIDYAKRINLSGDKLIITEEIPGVFIKGVQYYDLKNITSINYNGMASLLDFIKSQLEKGIEVKFVNVSEQIKNKITAIGLEHILNCA